jgi:uncharacterized protein YndB with AHSA1/START domain
MGDTATLNFTTPGPAVFVIRREFAAPRALVWRAWTDPSVIARWWGPDGFTTPAVDLDLRPGGRFRIVLRSPGGRDHPMAGIFREIVPPVRLVYTEVANPAEHGTQEALVTVTLMEKAGRTHVMVVTECAGPSERDFLGMGANSGWSQAFERLDRLLPGSPERPSPAA